jgi:hypothetical protein
MRFMRLFVLKGKREPIDATQRAIGDSVRLKLPRGGTINHDLTTEAPSSLAVGERCPPNSEGDGS